MRNEHQQNIDSYLSCLQLEAPRLGWPDAEQTDDHEVHVEGQVDGDAAMLTHLVLPDVSRTFIFNIPSGGQSHFLLF